jgi:hypothetical protein
MQGPNLEDKRWALVGAEKGLKPITVPLFKENRAFLPKKVVSVT